MRNSESFHDYETAGHPGKIGTYNAVQQHCWWPGLRTLMLRLNLITDGLSLQSIQ